MRGLIGAIVIVTVFSGVSAGASQPANQKKHKNAAKDTTVQTDRDGAAHVGVRVVFGTSDVQVLRRYYASRFADLPPGLRKKVMRGGSLPPGWQKKMEPFPIALERELSALPSGYSRGVIDAHAVIYNAKGIIIDVAVLF